MKLFTFDSLRGGGARGCAKRESWRFSTLPSLSKLPKTSSDSPGRGVSFLLPGICKPERAGLAERSIVEGAVDEEMGMWAAEGTCGASGSKPT